MSTPVSATIHSIISGRRRGDPASREHGSDNAKKVGPIKGEPIKWIAAFETGNPEIDDLHRALVRDCAALQALLADEAPWALIVDEARKLVAACIEHFRVEEAVLERIGFPRLAAHLYEHRRIEQELKILLTHLDQFDGLQKEHRELPATLVPALIDLIIRHDLDYRSHILHSQGR